MKSALALATVLAFLGSPALAQTTAPTNSSQMDAASGNNDQRSPADAAQNNSQTQDADAIQKIRQDLQKAGFTDVKVVARSFVVQAKSSDGNPVLMTIGPHGMSVFEAMGGAGSNSGTVGMGSAPAGTPGSNPSASPSQNSGSANSQQGRSQQ
ncbi:hypothetical protein [Bradyrhizobium sp. Gha]|uniref:hypothetical protein n=1 Tax=Bradyrhizobium sp. Gha TaxID=1855318 RepID=UPI0008EE69B6|nr:hypothetical protein [Bradyrhizobium sp. Gha]SFI52610.1 hypothetical protein SAMN05216525_11018 [Bradyrhizobium sp. Gha]